jgi:hypothetical protein
MGTVALMGNDTITVDGILITDFAGPGEVGKITFPTEISTVKSGKNENAIYSFNASGLQAVLEFKVIRGSSADVAMNTIVASYKSDPVFFLLKNATIVKKMGDGKGSSLGDTYQLISGVPTKQVETVINFEGDIEQALSVYTFTFATSSRTIAAAAKTPAV